MSEEARAWLIGVVYEDFRWKLRRLRLRRAVEAVEWGNRRVE